MSSKTDLASPALVRKRPVLVTGGAGFIGANLADRLASEGNDVVIFDALTRLGVEENLTWLKQRHRKRISSIVADIRDSSAVHDAVANASAVFHFAAQVAVTSSIAEPSADFDANLRGTFLVLEEIRRRSAPIPLIFASTNKVYGNLDKVELECCADAYAPRDRTIYANGISEDWPLDFHTPYGCSKGAADQYVLDYARSFGLLSTVLRMSCIYGPLQMGTEDQGWVAHFVIRALAGLPITIYGDGRQVRDVLNVADAVEAYLAAWRRIGRIRGRPFNLGGGPENAVSLRQVVAFIETLIERPITIDWSAWRIGDQKYYVSDVRRAVRELGLARPVNWRDGIAKLASWVRQKRPNPEERVPLPIDAEAS